MHSGVGVVAVKIGDLCGQPFALRRRQSVAVEFSQRQQSRPANRDVAIGESAGRRVRGVGAARPEAVDQVAADGRVGAACEAICGRFASAQAGQGHGRVGLAALVRQPLVEIGGRVTRAAACSSRGTKALGRPSA